MQMQGSGIPAVGAKAFEILLACFKTGGDGRHATGALKILWFLLDGLLRNSWKRRATGDECQSMNESINQSINGSGPATIALLILTRTRVSYICLLARAFQGPDVLATCVQVCMCVSVQVCMCVCTYVCVFAFV